MPRFSVYQLGRGSEPVIVVGSTVPAVAVGHDVEAGDFLLAQIHRQRVHVLLAEAADHHRVEKCFDAEIFRVPAWTRQ